MVLALLSFALLKAAMLLNQKAQTFWNRPRLRRTLIVNVVGIVPQILVVGLVLMYFAGIPPLTWVPILIFILIFFLAANSFDALWLCMTIEENDTGLRVCAYKP
jgi:hypothetical protein